MKFLSLLILTLLVTFQIDAQENWELRKEKNGIKVYTKTTEGSKLKASKVEMIVKTTIPKILSVLSDISQYTEWNPNTIESKLLKKNSDNDFYYRNVIKSPFVSNRDLIVHTKIIKKSNDYYLVSMKGAPDFIPEVDGLIRMIKYTGDYYIKKQKNGTIHIVLEYAADPAGKIPDFLVNSASVDVPYEIFTNLRERF
jgi:hypothetical protein